MTTDEATRAAASAALIWCALVPVLGWPSWQLDGLMIGTTRGALMRNAMIASLLIYLALDFTLRPLFGVDGLWAAFLLYYVARALTLAVGWPSLKRDFT
jgi:MATE family multidrug resistance protein